MLPHLRKGWQGRQSRAKYNERVDRLLQVSRFATRRARLAQFGDTIVDILRRLMSDVLRIDEDKITLETAIHETAGWNSLTHIELVVAIETTFRIVLTEDEIVAMTTVGKIHGVLHGRGVLFEQ